jgi:hypothetical protein
MAIENARISLNGTDIQVNTNGVVAHRLQVTDDFMPWVSRQAISAIREDDDSIGFDVTMLTGKRVRVYYGTSTIAPIQQNNNAVLDQLYRKIMLTGFDLTGTSMLLTEAASFYAVYKDHQTKWAQRAQLLAKIQDPDISIGKKTELVTELTGLTWTPINLSLYGVTYQVIFAEGMTCQFTNWVVGNYTDFSFNLVQREVLA